MARSRSRPSSVPAGAGGRHVPATRELEAAGPSPDSAQPQVERGWMWILYLWLAAFLLLGIYDMTLLILNLVRGTQPGL